MVLEHLALALLHLNEPSVTIVEVGIEVVWIDSKSLLKVLFGSLGLTLLGVETSDDSLGTSIVRIGSQACLHGVDGAIEIIAVEVDAEKVRAEVVLIWESLHTLLEPGNHVGGILELSILTYDRRINRHLRSVLADELLEDVDRLHLVNLAVA